MSKPLTLIQKFKLFRMYLKKQEDGVIIDCAYCGSTNVKFKTQSSHSVYHPAINSNEATTSTVYQSEYICNECGAKCSNRQEWFPA